MKIPYKDVYTYRYILEEYRGQLYPQTICTKALEKTEKYNHDPGTFARRTLPPSAAAGGLPKRMPPTPDQPEPHRFEAFERAAEDARRS